MARPFSALALAIAVGVGAACTGEPDIVEVSPVSQSAPAGTPPAAVAPPEPGAADPTMTAPAEPSPAMSEGEQISIATAFVDALRRSDVETAALMWSGYPEREEDRLHHVENLVDVHPWLLTSELEFTALASWSFQPESSMPIVAVIDADRTAAATFLLDREGVIQRIDNLAFQPARGFTVSADTLVIEGLPLEGSANGYLDGVLLAEPDVDYDAVTTTFALPPATGGPEVFIASWATPEYPFVTATILNRD